jgi:hypothetical protein
MPSLFLFFFVLCCGSTFFFFVPSAEKTVWIKTKYGENAPEVGSMTPSTYEKEGYLLRRKDSTGQWEKYYFMLTKDKLIFSHDTKVFFFSFSTPSRISVRSLSIEQQHNMKSLDLHLCSVKDPQPGGEEFVFGIQTPTRLYSLKASSQADMDRWLRVLARAIFRAYEEL